MSNPQNGERDSESPTLVPDGRSVPPAMRRVQSQATSADANTIVSPGPLSADAPTMIGDIMPTPLAPSEAPTLFDVRGPGGSPPRPASSVMQLPALFPGMILGGRYEILQTIGEGGM